MSQNSTSGLQLRHLRWKTTFPLKSVQGIKLLQGNIYSIKLSILYSPPAVEEVGYSYTNTGIRCPSQVSGITCGCRGRRTQIPCWCLSGILGHLRATRLFHWHYIEATKSYFWGLEKDVQNQAVPGSPQCSQMQKYNKVLREEAFVLILK